jgi:type IV secretory pathway TraG/TraD family ATPase VirD4
MAINDMQHKNGLAVLDPHGDLCEILLDYVPSYRLNDVCYLDPSNNKRAFHLNPLQVRNKEHAELVASGIVSIFHKLYHYSWGPRMEYIFRNALLTLVNRPQSTLVDVLKILSDASFRKKVVDKYCDDTIKNFWYNEFNKMSERLRSQAVSPIQNKVGQFVNSPTIRNIIGHPHSTIDLQKFMDEGKILIINLSQGKIGEDNAALLGAMLITKMQLAAMSRVDMDEEKRRDFYLYVDEFQNFATSSFVKILSEARKYRLNISVANQYMGQLTDDMQKAIFGNVGTLASFLVGAQDAHYLSREFGERYEEEDLVALDNFEILLRLSINRKTCKPFYAKSLFLPDCENENREKVLKLSRERYTKPIKEN